MTQTIKPTILFKRPETVPATVEFPLPDGSMGKLECQFKYRTRREYGEFVDEAAEKALKKVEVDPQSDASTAQGKSKSKAKDAAADKFSLEKLLASGNESNAESVLQYLVAWPEHLPPLNKENLIQVFDEAPAAAGAFWETYRNLCTLGRVGN